jgi:hypothetical protein
MQTSNPLQKVCARDLPLRDPVPINVANGLGGWFGRDEGSERAVLRPAVVIVAELANLVVDEDVGDAEDEAEDVACDEGRDRSQRDALPLRQDSESGPTVKAIQNDKVG